ncbi:unnamed protein product [Linum perenne]
MKSFSINSVVILAIALLLSLSSVAKAFSNGDDKASNYSNVSSAVDLMDYDIGSTGECLATYHYYRPKNMGWNMRDPTVNTYCSTWDAQKSFEWRSMYGWTAFCRSDQVPIGKSICGKCLKVTNERTSASTIARIVDQCTKPEGGLDLDDQTVFNVIDTDKKGYFYGHMKVSYEFVSC